MNDYHKKYNERIKIEKTCISCGSMFRTSPYKPAANCSNFCAQKSRFKNLRTVKLSLQGDIVYVPLQRNMQTIVDASDLDLVLTHNWYATKKQKSLYANTRINGKHVPLHRLIMKVRDSKIQVDHIDRDTLNNRRSNLRICTVSQNNRNKTGIVGASKYKGVSFSKANDRWRARIKVNRREIWGGHHLSEIDAARAYDRLAKEHHGEFAYLNFPEKTL